MCSVNCIASEILSAVPTSSNNFWCEFGPSNQVWLCNSSDSDIPTLSLVLQLQMQWVLCSRLATHSLTQSHSWLGVSTARKGKKTKLELKNWQHLCTMYRQGKCSYRSTWGIHLWPWISVWIPAPRSDWLTPPPHRCFESLLGLAMKGPL